MLLVVGWCWAALHSVLGMLQHLTVILVHGLVLLTLLFAICYRLGWWHRFLWQLMEQIASQALNGTPVTIGSYSLDLFRGKLMVNNVIVHAPQRAVYHWESPVLARLGHIQMEFNPVSYLFTLFILRDKENAALDVNLLYMSDIQAFLERKDQVFNVNLLDPFYVLPPPKSQQQPLTSEKVDEPVLYLEEPSQEQSAGTGTTSMSEEGYETTTTNMSKQEGSTYTQYLTNTNGTTTITNDQVDHRAELVVGEMLKAVQSLGRAVQDGQLPAVLQEQRQNLAYNLRQIQKPNKQTLASGMQLAAAVSEIVAKKSQKAVAQSSSILKFQRQAPSPPERPIYARFGRVILDDLRVFTRTTIAVVAPSMPPPTEKSSTNTTTTTQKYPAPQQLQQPDEEEGVEVTTTMPPMATTSCPNINISTLEQPSVADSSSNIVETPAVVVSSTRSSSTTALHSSWTATSAASTKAGEAAAFSKSNSSSKKIVYKSYWNKPIMVERVAVRASEFGAPLTAKDARGFPVLFQPLDCAFDAILKRVVGDMAKCNTGRLVRTALGEVLDFYMEREWQEQITPSPTTVTAAAAMPAHNSNKTTTPSSS